MSRITVIGVGYVGLVTATCMADMGHHVTAMDVDRGKIERLKDGEVPIYEPGLSDLIEENRPRMAFTADPAEAYDDGEFIFICVDTPPMYSGDADLSRIWAVIENLPPEDGDRILVTKSTVPVGTGASIQAVLEQRGYRHITYCSNPEFLREGTAIHDFLHPDRVVVGADDADARSKVAGLYAPLDAEIVQTTVASAEMIKYASNAFLATKISFINEIANVCEATGADVRTVALGMGMDERIGPHFLQAGIGYGGSCFPKDVSALKQLAGNSGYHFQLLTAVIEVNELQKRRVVGKLKGQLDGELRGKRIVLLGLAFKPNTDDVREASSIVLASRLLAEGADVVAHDPIAIANVRGLLPSIDFAEDPYSALEAADAAVLVTEWPDYIHLDWERAAAGMNRRILIDGRNALDWETLVELGFAVEGIGAAPADKRAQASPEFG